MLLYFIIPQEQIQSNLVCNCLFSIYSVCLKDPIFKTLVTSVSVIVLCGGHKTLPHMFTEQSDGKIKFSGLVELFLSNIICENRVLLNWGSFFSFFLFLFFLYL